MTTGYRWSKAPCIILNKKPSFISVVVHVKLHVKCYTARFSAEFAGSHDNLPV